LALAEAEFFPAALEKLLLNGFGQRGLNITGVLRRDGFDEDNPTLLVCNGIVQDALRYHAELAFFKNGLRAILELNTQVPLYYVKEFVFVVVLMPGNLPKKLRDFDELVIDTAYNLRGPMIGNAAERRYNVNRIHHEMLHIEDCRQIDAIAKANSPPHQRLTARNSSDRNASAQRIISICRKELLVPTTPS
jgi:hypothetical protein